MMPWPGIMCALNQSMARAWLGLDFFQKNKVDSPVLGCGQRGSSMRMT
jgi:hypothetical protein